MVATLCTQIHDLVGNAITVMQVLFPLIGVFRVVYRFAEGKEASMSVVVVEILVIIFVAVVFGQILKAVLGGVGCA
jgi:hypothetical protein